MATDRLVTDSESQFVLELDYLEQRLFDAERGEAFTVRVTQPLRIARRSVVALLGPSGCGKTTLLTVMGLLRSPSHANALGRFVMRTYGRDGTWNEHDVSLIWRRNHRRAVEQLRREHVGFALQSGELLPALTVRENIAAPLRLNGWTACACRERVEDLLLSFGLADSHSSLSSRRLDRSRINRLSGGEYQRVALARAIAHRPTLLYVDEPTSALNRELAWGALRQLRTLQCGPESHGAAVMITHDEYLAMAFADTIIRMRPVPGQAAGEVVEVVPNSPAKAGEFVDLQESTAARC